ncbi:MAG: SDR family oxidoreductase [Chitinophagales bacterium]|nr:SDR family oxidoreductase [Chitinophagales bacterium]
MFHNKDLSSYTFLVTGGAGFIGSHIVEYLIKNGAKKVKILDNLLTGNYENIKPFENAPNFEFIEGDITQMDTCSKACKGVDFISHQAALGSVPRSIKDPSRSNLINVSGYLNMLVAANEAGVKRVVYASSSSVYGDEPNLPKVEERIGKQLSPYAVTKYTNELYAHVFANTYGMQIIGLRYFNIFGSRQDPNGPYAAVIPLFVDKILKGEKVNIDGDGEQTRDFTYVDNAVQANIRAMLTDNEAAVNQVYNIAVGENFSVNYMYNLIQKYLNIYIEPNHREARKGDIRNSLADITKAKTLLGYDPQYRFEEGLKNTVEHFKVKFGY